MTLSDTGTRDADPSEDLTMERGRSNKLRYIGTGRTLKQWKSALH